MADRVRVFLRGGSQFDLQADSIKITTNDLGAITSLTTYGPVGPNLEFLRGDAVDAVLRLAPGE